MTIAGLRAGSGICAVALNVGQSARIRIVRCVENSNHEVGGIQERQVEYDSVDGGEQKPSDVSRDLKEDSRAREQSGDRRDIYEQGLVEHADEEAHDRHPEDDARWAKIHVELTHP